MKCVFILLFMCGITILSISSRRIEFYRKDYTYFEKFNAFYKLHWSEAGYSWRTAFEACNEEEATLFYPKEIGEGAVVKNLTYASKKRPNISDIFVGLHDKFGVGEFTAVTGYSTYYLGQSEENSADNNCVVMNVETGKFEIAPCLRFPYSPLPFVCKKYDTEYCPTIDPGYKYVSASKKCYKINKRRRTWDEAVRACYIENGMLIVLQNQAEASEIKKILKLDTTYHAGLRRNYFGSDYYTIKGQNIDDVYQEEYDNNNKMEVSRFDCGALYYNRNDYVYTVATNCSAELPFICEMDLNKL